jgi:uncharacterized protein DUF2188
MSRKRIHVTSHPNGWQVKPQGGTRASSVHSTKDAAVESATSQARRSKPSQVMIHGKNGRFQSERTYGSDPFPPPG